jgi:hypothetical protein
MALNVDKVWVRTPQGEVLVPLTRVHAGDEVVVRSGNMIPLDGMVLDLGVSSHQLDTYFCALQIVHTSDLFAVAFAACA